MKRYKLFYCRDDETCELDESSSGPYILYSDHLAAVAGLVGACNDFIRNCPACGGKGRLDFTIHSTGEMSPEMLCVWCKKFREALGIH